MHLQTIIGLLFLPVITNAENCVRTKIDDELFKRQLIATVDGYPANIVIDPRTNNILFILHKRNYTKGLHLLKHGSLRVKGLPVAGHLIGQCVGVDVPNNIIYVGTNQGIVTYDYSGKEISAEKPKGDDDVRDIFIDNTDNQMYITTGPNYEIFNMNDRATVRYEKIPRAYNFVQDSKKNVYYEYVDGRLYFLSADYYEPIQYKGFTKSIKFIIKLNNRDEAILAVKGSLFKLSTKHILPQKIGHLGFKITGIAFDKNNNIIVGAKGVLYRFEPIDSRDPCPVDDYII